MAGRQRELSFWLARYHPLGEGHGQAGMVLRPVQGKEHGAQPLPTTQGKQQKLLPSPLRERDQRQPHEPRTQQASSIDSNSQPMRTAHLAPRPSKKPASASNASENTTLAKAQDKIQIPTLKYTRNQLKDTTVTRRRDRSMEETNGSGHKAARQAAPGKKTSQNHNTALQTPGNTQAAVTAQYTHSTLLKSSNRPTAAARRRQGQQLYAWHGTPSRRSQVVSPFPQTPSSEATQPQPPALPLEARPCEYKTNKAKQPKRDKVFPNTNHS